MVMSRSPNTSSSAKIKSVQLVSATEVLTRWSLIVNGIFLALVIFGLFADLFVIDWHKESGAFGLYGAILILLAIFAMRGMSYYLFHESWLQAVLFFALVLGLQGYAAWQETLWNVFLEPAGGQCFWPPDVWLDYENILNCLRIEVEKMYRPPLGGVTENFAFALVVNGLLLLAYAIIFLPLLKGCVWFANFCYILMNRYYLRRGRLNLDAVDEEQKTDPSEKKFATGVERVMLIDSGIVALTIFAFLPVVLVLLPEGKGEPVSRQLSDLLWVGPLIVMMELARLAWQTDEDPVSIVQDTELPIPTDLPRVLPDVDQRIREKFSDRQHLHFELPAQVARVDENEKLAALDGLEAGQSIQFMETLTPRHFEHLSRLLQRLVIDRGRSAIIICPPQSLNVVETAFQQTAHQRRNAQVQVWRVLDHVPNRDLPIDVIVCSLEHLQEMCNKSEEYDTELRRLGAIFVLNLDQIDTGLLRIATERLRSLVPHHDDVSVIAQSEPILDQDQRVAQLIWSGEKLIHSGLRIDDQSNRFVTIWNARSDETGRDAEKEKLDLSARLMRFSFEESDELMDSGNHSGPPLGPYIWDRFGRFNQTYWRKNVVRALRNDENEKIADIFTNIEPQRLGPPPSSYPIAVIEDVSNLADALRLGVGNGEMDVVVEIVQRNYPLGNLMYEKLSNGLDEAGSDSRELRHVLDKFHEEFGSLSPLPKNGPVEHAQAVVAELEARRQGMSQRRIKALREFTDSKTLRQLRVSATKVGLSRLFQLAIGARLQLNQSRDDNHIPNYAVSDSDRERARRAGSLRFLDLFDTNNRRQPIKLADADHGLTYALGTELLIDETRFKVNRQPQDGYSIGVQRDEDVMTDTSFERVYAFHLPREVSFEPANRHAIRNEDNFAVIDCMQEPNGKHPSELALCHLQVARRTVATHRYQSIDHPFADDRAPQRYPCDVPAPSRLRNALLLRTYGAQQKGRRTQKSQFSNTAFTLCVTLQDTLQALFPMQFRRLAVFSPGDLGLRMDNLSTTARSSTEALRHFAIRRQPCLGLLYPDSDEVNPSPDVQLLREASDRFEDFGSAVLTKARHEQNLRPIENAEPLIDLYIVEDSDHDLGVVRAISEDWKRVLELWLEFLTYCENYARNNGEFFYKFGTTAVPDCFDFAGAREIVESLNRPLKDSA